MQCSTRQSEIPLTFVAFDVLSGVMEKSYREGRRILDGQGLNGPRWRFPGPFVDGLALWDAVCEHELEGVVAQRVNEPYLAGELAWVSSVRERFDCGKVVPPCSRARGTGAGPVAVPPPFVGR